jgi:hypothetical protein
VQHFSSPPDVARDCNPFDVISYIELDARQKIIVFTVTREQEFDPIFAAVTQAGADALFVGASAFFFSRCQQLIKLTAPHQIPASDVQRQFVGAGGPMSYSGSQLDSYRRAATADRAATVVLSSPYFGSFSRGGSQAHGGHHRSRR